MAAIIFCLQLWCYNAVIDIDIDLLLKTSIHSCYLRNAGIFNMLINSLSRKKLFLRGNGREIFHGIAENDSKLIMFVIYIYLNISR